MIIPNLPFSEYQKREGVNKSLLDHFAESPAKAKWAMEQPPTPPTKPMVIGSLVDIALFEPARFADAFHLRPDSYTDEKGQAKRWSSAAKSCKAWLKERTDRPVITSKELKRINRMADAVASEPKAKMLMSANTWAQLSLFAKCPTTGLLLKGRPDAGGEGFLADLKASEECTTDWLARQIAAMRWHVQGGFYVDLARLCGLKVKKFFLVVVSRKEPHHVNVRELEPMAVELGRSIYQKELLEFARCRKNGIWPGPSGEGNKIGTVDVPTWEYKRVNGDDEPLMLTFGGKQHAL